MMGAFTVATISAKHSPDKHSGKLVEWRNIKSCANVSCIPVRRTCFLSATKLYLDVLLL